MLFSVSVGTSGPSLDCSEYALLACWVSVGSLRTTKYLWNNSYRAVFLDGLLPELVELGWELSSLELIFLSEVIGRS